jgi:hypothetical protein
VSWTVAIQSATGRAWLAAAVTVNALVESRLTGAVAALVSDALASTRAVPTGVARWPASEANAPTARGSTVSDEATTSLGNGVGVTAGDAFVAAGGASGMLACWLPGLASPVAVASDGTRCCGRSVATDANSRLAAGGGEGTVGAAAGGVTGSGGVWAS